MRTDGVGAVTQVGVLLRATPLGEITRSIVSGRVRYGETVRDALFRHLENDLGPMAFPQLPPQPVPFTVAEYFPLPGVSAFHDDRQHAVVAGVRHPGHRHMRAAPGCSGGDLDDPRRGIVGGAGCRNGGRALDAHPAGSGQRRRAALIARRPLSLVFR